MDVNDAGTVRNADTERFSWLRRHTALLLSSLLLGGAILASSEMLAWRYLSQEQAQILERAQTGADVTQQIVLRRIEAVDVLHRMAQSWVTLRHGDNLDGAAAVENLLSETANSGSFGFIQVAIIGTDGWMEWSSLTRYGSRVFLGDREHFRVHADGMREMFISTPVLGRVSNRWTLQLTRPLFDPSDRFAGVVVVSLDLLNLSEAMTELQSSHYERAGLLRGDGLVVASTADPARRIGQELPAADPLRQRNRSAATGALARSSFGAPNFTGWRRVPGTDLTAVFVIEAEALTNDVGPIILSTRIAALTLSMLTLAGATLILFARERTRTNDRLGRIARQQQVAEESHRLFERRLNTLPSIVFGGVISADRSFQFTYVTDNLTRITGWDRAQLDQAAPWGIAADGVPPEAHAAFLAEVLANGAASREFLMRRANGTAMLVREHLRVVERLSDGTTEVAGYLRDITSEKDIELKAQAAGRLATLGEMATGLAHELNQPLAVMSLAADNGVRALQRRGADAIPDVLKRLDRIGIQARRARDIVDHLRVFGRPQEDGLPEPVTLAHAVDGAVVLTRAALRDAGVELVLELPEELPRVMARLIPLEQIVVNLVINARDAITEARREHGVITITARQAEDGMVKLEVVDNGGGLPNDVMYRMFEPFFTTKPPGKGTGLGLPYCHATMRAFGGSIEAANGTTGAVFTLWFQPA